MQANQSGVIPSPIWPHSPGNITPRPATRQLEINPIDQTPSKSFQIASCHLCTLPYACLSCRNSFIKAITWTLPSIFLSFLIKIWHSFSGPACGTHLFCRTVTLNAFFNGIFCQQPWYLYKLDPPGTKQPFIAILPFYSSHLLYQHVYTDERIYSGEGRIRGWLGVTGMGSRIILSNLLQMENYRKKISGDLF